MRYIKASIVPLFLLLLVATTLPISASDDFENWAMKRAGEIDRRWKKATTREAGAATSNVPDRTMTVSRRFTTMIPGRSASRTGKSSRPTAANSTGIDGSRFTKRGSHDFLRQSTRVRNDPSRGISKLRNPAQSVRASSAKRRLPFNSKSTYRRKSGYGRAGAWRKSAKMGTRISTSGNSIRRRASTSMTRGATRSRRSARTGR